MRLVNKIGFGFMFVFFPAMGFAAGGTSDSLGVSSGSFVTKNVDLVDNNTGNVRQAVVIGDPVLTQTMQVDTSSSAFVNQTEVNGVTVSVNNGASGTGVQRVNVAYDNTPFQISGSPEISQVFVTTTSFVAVSTFSNTAASTTDGILVGGITGKNIYVLGLALVSGGTSTNVTFNQKGGGAGTAISMTFANASNGGAVLPFSSMPWFATTTKGNALSVTTGAGSTTGIQILYVAY